MKLSHSNKLCARTEGTAKHLTTVGRADKRRVGSRYLTQILFVILGGLAITKTPAYASGLVLDEDFSPSLNGRVREIVVQPDNKVLIAGEFVTVDGATVARFARLNSNGVLDTSFSTGPGASHPVFAIALQDDGKIVIGGDFTVYNGSNVRKIVRINADGTLDTSFDNFGNIMGADSGIYELYIASNGQVIAAGDFQSFNGVSRKRIVKLNSSNGSIDTSFNLEFNSRTTKIIPLDGNELLAVGFFTQIKEPPSSTYNRSGIGLITENGTVFSDFTGTGANGIVWDAIRLSNDQILIGGDFTSFNGTTKTRLALFNSDNTLNTDFQATANGRVRALLPVGNNKILLGGDFTEINGIARPYLAMINLDGSLDIEFDITPSSIVDSLAQDSEGNVYIGGDFTEVNNTTHENIAKLKLEDDELCIVIKIKNGGFATPCL